MSLQTQEGARKYFRRKWNKPKTFVDRDKRSVMGWNKTFFISYSEIRIPLYKLNNIIYFKLKPIQHRNPKTASIIEALIKKDFKLDDHFI